MDRKTRIRLELPYLYIITVFFLTFNAVKYWPIPGAITIASGIGIVMPFFICRSFLKTNQLGYFMIYAIVVILNYLLGDKYFGNSNSLFLGFVGFFVSMSLSYYVFKSQEYNLMRVIFYTLMIVLLWTTLATAYFDMTSPGLVRYAFGLQQRGSDEAAMFNPMYFWGLSSYAFPHAIPVLIPPFIMGLRNSSLKMKRRLLSGVLAFCCLLLVYFSGATGPLLVSIMVLFMSFVIHEGRTSSNIIKLTVILLLLTPFLLSKELQLMTLEWVDSLLGGEGYFHYKVVDFQESILYGASGDVEERQDLYGSSLAVLFENPLNIIVGAQDGYGGHSALLDRLASLGLVGFIPFICLFVAQFKFVLKFLQPRYRSFYYLGLFAAFMMLASKNVSGWNMWFLLFTALPFCIYIFSDTEDALISR